MQICVLFNVFYVEKYSWNSLIAIGDMLLKLWITTTMEKSLPVPVT